MLNIQIISDNFYIKSIDKTSINKIYSIYRNSNDFKYATGFFQPIEHKQFSYSISQFIQRKNVFFLDIRLNTGETIGLIKGVILIRDNIVWINSIVIDTPYQRQGYGKKVVELLEEYFSNVCSARKIYLSVFKTNTQGLNFWEKCGFELCNELPDKGGVRLNSAIQIMCKLLI